MTGRRLEYMPLTDLRPDPRNPKAHDADDLRASMGRFGYTEPILLDERTGLLVAGHGRRGLLLDDFAAGREPPEGVEVGDDDGWLVPVIRGWASQDDTEALGYLIASNRLPEKGGWAQDLLRDALGVLADAPIGLEGIGYDGTDLAAILADLAPVEPEGVLPPEPEQRTVQGLHEVGLIFQAGQFAEYQELVATLKRQWAMDASPLAVLRALRQASEAATHG